MVYTRTIYIPCEKGTDILGQIIYLFGECLFNCAWNVVNKDHKHRPSTCTHKLTGLEVMAREPTAMGANRVLESMHNLDHVARPSCARHHGSPPCAGS